MMRWIVESSLKYRLVVVAVAVAIMAAGARQISEMSVDVLPEFTPTMVEIQTEALGLSAPEVEQLITVPMEQDLLNGVPWLDDIRSESVPGLSRIQLIFEPGTDLLRARQVVQERMTQAVALPQVSTPPLMVQPLSSLSRVMMARLSSDDVSPIDMSVIAHWTIRPRLLGVPGVANVSIWGYRDRQLQVQVDPERLRDTGVSLLDVIETTGNALWVSPLTFLEASTPGTGGFIDTPNQRLGIQHMLPIKTADDLAQVPLTADDIGGENPGDQLLRIGDVASVVEDHQPLIGDNISGDGDGDLLLVIEKFPDANTLEVTQGVEAALAALAPGLTGIDVDTSVYRPASSMETAIDNLGAALLLGAFLLVLVIAAFSYDWRSTVISAVAIPLSVVAAGLVLYLRGAGLNAMILTGFVVALSALIGDAITPVDAIRRRLYQQQQEPIRNDDGGRHSASRARNTRSARLRDIDRSARSAARLLRRVHVGSSQRVLRPSRPVLRVGAAGLDGRCAYRHAGARAAPVEECATVTGACRRSSTTFSSAMTRASRGSFDARAGPSVSGPLWWRLGSRFCRWPATR